MNKKTLLAASIVLLILAFAVIAVCGSRYTGTYQVWGLDSANPEDISVIAEEPGIVEVTDFRVAGNEITLDLHALSRGTTYLDVMIGENMGLFIKCYVHRFNIITINSYLGNCTGGFVVPLAILILLVLVFINRMTRYRAETKENLYSYRNILHFGVLVFLLFLILDQVPVILQFRGIEASIVQFMASAEAFAYIVLPVALVVSVLISLSNLNLMRKEGVNWRNMLGFFLGLCLCLMTVLPDLMYRFFLRHPIINIFNEKGVGTHLYSFLERSVFFIIAYLECILLGTVVFGVRAARRIPAFDKDYLLILGSQIRPDGTLTPLLQARADRAMEFADMQKAAGGKELVFVPSGGQGADEVTAEAAAIRDYLLSKGAPEDRILVEDRSVNTYENIRNSAALIRADYKTRNPDSDSAPKTAFSTTNYHVFRAGLIASELGEPMEGIGSPTKRYFWVNAFIREFIATLVSEKRRHLKMVAALLLGVLVLVALNYASILL